MAEIKTAPITGTDEGGNDVECFTDDHTLADIVRWLMRNRAEAEEVYRMLGEELSLEKAQAAEEIDRLERIEKAADELADRAREVFHSEYHNTSHIEGSKEYFDQNMKTLHAFRKAQEKKE